MNREQISQIEATLAEKRFGFAINGLHKVMQINPRKNLAFSPFCIYDGLMMIYLIIHGNTEEQLKNILDLTNLSKDELLQYYKLKLKYKFLLQLRYESNMVYPFQNDYIKLWLREDNFLISSRYHIMNEYLEKFNCIDPIQRINYINRTIKNNLKYYMIHPMKLSVARKDMEFILMHIFRFKLQQFQISTACQFDAPSVSIIPDKRKLRESYCKELSMHVSEFPYQNDNLSLFILLPASIDSQSGDCRIKKDAIDTDISSMVERLSTKDGMCKLRYLLHHDATSQEDTNFSKRPIFRVEKNLKIRELLLALGLEKLISFDAIHEIEGADDISFVHLGNAVHRTYVNVTEKATLASAITMFYTGQESSPNLKQVDVNCNYPFVWLIYHKTSRIILFIGVFNKFAESVRPPQETAV